MLRNPWAWDHRYGALKIQNELTSNWALVLTDFVIFSVQLICSYVNYFSCSYLGPAVVVGFLCSCGNEIHQQGKKEKESSLFLVQEPSLNPTSKILESFDQKKKRKRKNPRKYQL